MDAGKNVAVTTAAVLEPAMWYRRNWEG